MVALQIDRGPGPSSGTERCTGTLISPTTVLTAAHCLYPVVDGDTHPTPVRHITALIGWSTLPAWADMGSSRARAPPDGGSQPSSTTSTDSTSGSSSSSSSPGSRRALLAGKKRPPPPNKKPNRRPPPPPPPLLPGAEAIPATRWAPYPEYDPRLAAGDVGVVTLQRASRFAPVFLDLSGGLVAHGRAAVVLGAPPSLDTTDTPSMSLPCQQTTPLHVRLC